MFVCFLVWLPRNRGKVEESEEAGREREWSFREFVVNCLGFLARVYHLWAGLIGLCI